MYIGTKPLFLTIACSHGALNKSNQHINVLYLSFVAAVNKSSRPCLRYKLTEQGSISQEVLSNPWTVRTNMSVHIDRLATSLTNAIRRSLSGNMVVWQAFTVETYISAQFAWLSYPIAVLLFTSFFLAATIVNPSQNTDTNDLNMWKSSAMLALIYNIPKHVRNEFTSKLMSTGISKDITKRVRLHLFPYKK